MPLISCSSGAATVSLITLGFAPGYAARTCTVGGVTAGYSLSGNCVSEIAPMITIIADSTTAKMGRLTKKCVSFTAGLLSSARRSA